MYVCSREKERHRTLDQLAQLRSHLARKCDGKHEHQRWGETATGFAQLKSAFTTTRHLGGLGRSYLMTTP